MKKMQIFQAQITCGQEQDSVVFERNFISRPTKRQILRSIPHHFKDGENWPKKLSPWAQGQMKLATQIMKKVRRMNYNKHGFFHTWPIKSNEEISVYVHTVDVFI